MATYVTGKPIDAITLPLPRKSIKQSRASFRADFLSKIMILNTDYRNVFDYIKSGRFILCLYFFKVRSINKKVDP